MCLTRSSTFSGPGYFEAQCLFVPTLVTMLGHTRITILKLDIEGAKYEVLQNILDQRVPVDVICVEFDQPSPLAQAFRMLTRLREAHYDVVNVEGLNFTLVRSSPSTAGA